MESDDDNTQSHIILSKGMMISHYRIVEKIGAGGMGEVYLAEDTKLNRNVALKFLSSHLCQDEDCRARFKREAQAVAKLSHPNIVHIYEVGEYKNRPFFVMEHVEGLSLKEFSAAKNPSIERILELGIQICEGLNDAHEKGVTHRDIKPSNILVDSHGRAKIVDFGLASVVGTDQLTKTGSTLGTIGYMSPEQVQGKEIDHRSDLFSLGVVLYELITNQNPFKRDNEAATLKAVSDDLPEPLARFKSGLPDGLEAIIDKALEKDVKTRYQHADGMLSDLMRVKRSLESGQSTVSGQSASEHALRRWWPAALMVIVAASVLIVTKPWRDDSTSDKPDRIMLAVLPFKNLGNVEDEYFADGITEEIMSRLSSISGLGVISSTSSFTYKGSDKTVPQIAQELSVDYVLEGNIRWDKSGDVDLVRVMPQLIQASGDVHLWSKSYDEAIINVFEVQSQIASQIANILDVQLTASEESQVSDVPTKNMDAYSRYLKAVGLDAYDKQPCLASLSLLSEAIQLDSAFALAYAEMSFRMSAYHYHHALTVRSDTICRAREYAETAFALDPVLPAAYRALGQYYYWVESDLDSALQQFNLALDLNPNNSGVLWSMALVNRRMGRWEETLNYFGQASMLDPTSVDQDYLRTTLLLKKYDLALDLVDGWLLFHPDWYTLQISRARILGLISNDLDQFANNVPADIKDYLARGLVADQLLNLRFMQRDYEASMQITWRCREYADTEFGIALCHTHLAQVQYYLGGNRNSIYADSAIYVLQSLRSEDFTQSTAARTVDAITLSVLGLAYGQKSDTARAREFVDLALRADIGQYDSPNASHVSYFSCLALIRIGDYDRAIDLLENLLSMPSIVSLFDVKYEPHYDPLRDHPRFQALIEKYEKNHGR